MGVRLLWKYGLPLNLSACCANSETHWLKVIGTFSFVALLVGGGVLFVVEVRRFLHWPHFGSTAVSLGVLFGSTGFAILIDAFFRGYWT